jgi:acyl-CoA synthetase (AMP-forming)/AMP-acid ligase II
MQRFSSIIEVLQRHAFCSPDALAVVLDSGLASNCLTLSYGSLYAQASNLAADLQLELSPGDRALLIFPTCLEFVVSFFACLMAGVVAVPLMVPRRNSNQDASATIISDCQPRLVLCLPRDAEVGSASKLLG